jgi:hypothetical protein
VVLDGTTGGEFPMRMSMRNFGNLEELTGASICFASDAAGFVTGQLLAVDVRILASGVNR